MKQDESNESAFGGELPFHQPPIIPDHSLLRLIGAGTYGEVWLARHDVLKSYVAVKVVYRDRFREDRPFEREMDGIQKFEPLSRAHSSQMRIIGVGRCPGAQSFYYGMELADDQNSGPNDEIDPARYQPRSLRNELNVCGRLPAAECLRIALALADALEYLHEEGCIHRDIKPSNIIFVNGRAKLADPGLVAHAGVECSFVGTEGYIAPEGPGNTQADIYALGKVLYQAITGFALDRYPSLPESWTDLPDHEQLKELNQIVNRACEPRVADRYQSASEMRSDLEVVKSGASLVRFNKLRRTARLAALAAAAVIVIAVVGGSIWGLIFFHWRASEQARQRELRDLQVVQLQVQISGWFSNAWWHLDQIAALRIDPEVLRQAMALLAGIDAHVVALHHKLAATSAAFGPGGVALLAGSEGMPAFLLDTNGMVSTLAVRGLGSVCWSPVDEPLQFAAVSNAFELRDARDGKVQREFNLPEKIGTRNEPVSAMAVSVDGRFVAASAGGRLAVWDSSSGTLIGEVEVAASAIKFRPDDLALAVGTSSGTTLIYSIPGLMQIATLPPPLRGNPVSCLAFASNPLVRYPEGKSSDAWLLAVGDQGAGIVVWDLEKSMPKSFCFGSTWNVQALTFSPDGQLLASGGRNEVRLWDVASGKFLLSLANGSSSDSPTLAFDSSGHRLLHGALASSDEASVVLYDLEFGRGIVTLRGMTSAIRKLLFAPSSERVAALSDDWHLA